MDQPKTHSTPESQGTDLSIHEAINNWRNAKRNREQSKSRRQELRMVALAVVTGAIVLLATRLHYSEPVSAETEPERIITPNIAPAYPSTRAGALFTLDASTYADKYEGRPTASGITYRHSKPIAASNRHRLGTRVSITYRGRTVYAVIEDRLAKRHSNRIDLSRSLWNALTNNAAPSIARGCKVMEVAR